MKVDLKRVDEELEKAIGKRLKAAGMAGLMGIAAASPSVAQAPVPPPAAPAPQVASQDNFGSEPEDRFLWTIMQVESSGGTNTAHKKMTAGIHAGESAMGRWGLMPNTVREMVTRASQSGKSSPALESLGAMDHAQMDKFFKKNPHVELEIARKLARHVMRRQGYNRERAAFAWNQGHNLFGNEVSHEDVHGHPYVASFRKFHRINPIRPQKTMAKSDGSTFRERFSEWEKRRSAQARQPAPKDRTYVYDPGRRRDDELDERDAEVKAPSDVRTRIKNKIRSASEADPGGNQ